MTIFGSVIDYHQPNLERGEYEVILQLISTIPDGELVKAQVDEAIDQCGVLQNLRSAIYDCKRKAQMNAENRPASFWIKRGQNYLERYATHTCSESASPSPPSYFMLYEVLLSYRHHRKLRHVCLPAQQTAHSTRTHARTQVFSLWLKDGAWQVLVADHLQRVSAPPRAQVLGVVQRVDEEQMEDAKAVAKARARLTRTQARTRMLEYL